MGSDGRGWQSEVLLGAGGGLPVPTQPWGGEAASTATCKCSVPMGLVMGGTFLVEQGCSMQGNRPLLRHPALPQAGRAPRGCHRCGDPSCGGDHTCRPCQPRLGGEGVWGDLGATEWQGKSVQQGGWRGKQGKKA